CLISLFFTFRSVTSRSLSPSVISSGPSCISPAWGCQEDISTLLKGDIITLLPQGLFDRNRELAGFAHLIRIEMQWGTLFNRPASYHTVRKSSGDHGYRGPRAFIGAKLRLEG